jgi:predicted helicase
MAHLEEVLEKFNDDALSQKEKGDSFERLMVGYLRTTPLFSGMFTEVWRWIDFPWREGISLRDTGIDIVGQYEDGGLCAVQCKFFRADIKVYKDDVDGFLATSGKEFNGPQGPKTRFAERLLITTSNRWSSEAENALNSQNPQCNIISRKELEEARVDWRKLDEGIFGPAARLPPHFPRLHQHEAIKDFHNHFKLRDRGQLILPCATGKSLTALWIAERETDGRGLVLFLAPSIALIGQTLRAWTADAMGPIEAVCVCSDVEISKALRKTDEDSPNVSPVELARPATTSHETVKHRIEMARKRHPDRMCVVFSTYHSMEAVSKAIGDLKSKFDIIICDEAHRTTGHSLADDDEKGFKKVHDNTFLPGLKRLYMTATPRIYGDAVKQKASENSVQIVSMDDETLFGPPVYWKTFANAVKEKLLSDYKVLVFTVDPTNFPKELHDQIADGQAVLNTDSAAKLIGCIYALSKRMELQSEALSIVDPGFMHKSVAFCKSIKDSKNYRDVFNDYSKTFLDSLAPEKRANLVDLHVDHIDGTMGAMKREALLADLNRADPDTNRCNILFNCRVLGEGLDVPSLDAVIFMSSKNSEIDVVQSVGRVMRLAPGKKYGYIIIPIVVNPAETGEKALDSNQTYKVVWSVLNALKSHDRERFSSLVNKIRFNETKPEGGGAVLIGGPSDDFGEQEDAKDCKSGGDGTGNVDPLKYHKSLVIPPDFMAEYRDSVYARLVRKVGRQSDMLEWAEEVGDVAKGYISRIGRLVKAPGEHRQEFQRFLEDLRKNLNPSVDADEAVMMLAQHMVTKPIFEALFENYSFARLNPVSVSMQGMVELLDSQSLRKDADELEPFYDKATGRIKSLESSTVKEFVTGIDNSPARQRIITDLYNNFFKVAFKEVTERLGIVYTPVPVVDFIIHSVAEVLKREFKRNISDENVHILDPFTGTGTFITRIIQSGLLGESLEEKFKHDLHANEILLLPYYIASLNIENAYHGVMGEGSPYTPFEGICLTDTFQLFEYAHDKRRDGSRSDLGIGEKFFENSARLDAQTKTPIMVILGNPPYSIGQKSANDNAQNLKYDFLDGRIKYFYSEKSKANLKKALHDSYIKAFRWGTERLLENKGQPGIIAYVTNSGWLDSKGMDGVRKCFAEEFNSIFVFNLRGNCRLQGEARRKENGNVFGLGSRTPVAVTVLVRNPAKTGEAEIFYSDIGDYKTREEKLEIIKARHDIYNPDMAWRKIIPNAACDWLNQRSDSFAELIRIGNKDKKSNFRTFFEQVYSHGISTNRDAWVFNSSEKHLKSNIRDTINFYNEQREAYFQKSRGKGSKGNARDIVDNDGTKISWSNALLADLTRDNHIAYGASNVVVSSYRPFFKQHLYYDRSLNERTSMMPKLFPSPDITNKVICVPHCTNGLPLMSDCIPDLHFNGDSQCFPLYWYEEDSDDCRNLFSPKKGTANSVNGYVRHDGITDFILDYCRKLYGKGAPQLTKNQIFHYVYGILHSKIYLETFEADLKKSLPRIPLVPKARDFMEFANAGKALAGLHLGYESAKPYRATVSGAESGRFQVEKMRFGKCADGTADRTVIQYNAYVRVEGIPPEAYRYVLNGKPAVDWIMERYQIKTDKNSGIRNDPNDWSKERGEPRYILDLLLKVITVSLKTMQLVDALSKLDFS